MSVPSIELRFASPADLEAGRTLLCGGSRSFYAASFLLPRRVREPATALYAFCRLADDEIDLAQSPAEAVTSLRRRLDCIYDGHPMQLPTDRALADVVTQFDIPRELLDALLEGFAWDAEGRAYPDLSGVYAYAARVAGTVGAMMALLMGVRNPDLIARACDLGVAMQLSNIARDVGEDAARGRVYLPLDWLREADIDARDWLAAPTWTPALGKLVDRLLDAADRLYARADMGIAGLPLGCRPGIGAARRLYAEIGLEVRRRGLDSVTQRAVVAPGRKLALLAPIIAAALYSRPPQAIAPLPETRFLVEAVRNCPVRLHKTKRPGSHIEDRLVWVLDLFERLERRDRGRRGGALPVESGVPQALVGMAGRSVALD